MAWIFDPAAWVGLLTLIVLEIVLGIDNLIFIAIIAEKLPPSQRGRARILGMSLALIMRLVLLSVMSWLVTLTRPLFHLGPFGFSGRDLILLAGGLFLLFKGTVELHERLEGGELHANGGPRIYASFWVIVTQIVVLDAVFSIDSIITALGVAEHLAIMMIAVVVAIGIMMSAAKMLTRFVNRHPTVVVLCLGFLLMIGFSLVAEALGIAVPKSYLYAAIGFSVLIEALNQVARRNLLRLDARRPMRERTAEAVLRMLGKRPVVVAEGGADMAYAQPVAFGIEERNMVSGVLTLAERSISSIMTPRTEVSWIDLNDDPKAIERQISESPHTFFPVCKGSLDEIVGVGRAKTILAQLLRQEAITREVLRDPIIVSESFGILRLIETLKRSRGQLVLVADEFGGILGLVTAIDVLEAIAGEFPDEDEQPDIIADGDGVWKIDGAADLRQVEQVLDTEGLTDDDDEYSTLAGYLLNRFGQLPAVGDVCEHDSSQGRFRFEVLNVDGRRIAMVRVSHLPWESDVPEQMG